MEKSRSVWSWGKVFELVTVSFHIYCMCRCKLIFKVPPFSVFTLFCYVEITTYASASSRIFIGQSLRLCQSALHLTIGSYVSVRSSRYEARGKFGEDERCVRVSRGVAESNSSLLSALQTSQVLHISMTAHRDMRFFSHFTSLNSSR